MKNSVPNGLKEIAKKVLACPEMLRENMKLIMDNVSDKRFLDSWKGAFVTTEFTAETREEVPRELKRLL
ncbi:MAG: hypothetical protein ACLFU9_07940 [Candidatus Bathyarchaeia archaeon]